ncbi:MAG: hypothetical protein J6A01_04395 [Proteobacteria bacterium]|nr:hypothetical protein [Pseudomonadota bacterium]
MSRIRSLILVISAFLLVLCISSTAAMAQDSGRIAEGDINGRMSLDEAQKADSESSGAADAAENASVQADNTTAPKKRVLLDDDDDDDTDGDASSNPVAAKPAADENSLVKGHGLQMGVNFLGMPDGAFDIWFSHHGSTWDGVVNMGFNLDYFLRFKAPCEMRFSLAWNNARTGSAYWLDKRYDDRPHLADYIVNKYHVLSIEVAAYHVISIIDEIAFYYGGGGWGGLVMGEARGHAIRSACAESEGVSENCPHEPGSVKLTQMPKFFGFAMVTLGFKFTLWEIMTIRAEGGFKGYLYGQLGLGVEF